MVERGRPIWMVASAALCLALGAAWYGGSVEAGAGWPDLSTPPAATGGGEKDAAVVIAIEDYLILPDVAGAVQNGTDWFLYLSRTRKVPTVKFLKNTDGSREDILAAVRTVRGQVQPGGKLWVVFIGHGAPAEDGQDGLLVGVDAQQKATSILPRSVPLKEIEAAAGGVPVLAVLDACFSGKAAGGMLAPDLQPVIPVYAVGGGMTVLAAGSGNQFAGPLAGAQRPAFSYLLLGAMRGWGDGDGDGQVSAAEAIRYTNQAIAQTVNGREQTPELKGADVMIGRGREAGPDLAGLTLEIGSGNTVQGSNAGTGQAEVILTNTGAATAWTAEDDAILASQEAKVRRAAREKAAAAQDAEAGQKVKARQSAVASEWAQLEAVMGAPEQAGAEEKAAVAAKVAKWKADSVDVSGQKVALTGSVAWNGRTKSLDGKYEEVAAKKVTVDNAAIVAKAEAWMRRVPAAAAVASVSSGGSVSSGSDWTSPTLGKMKWIKPGTFTMGSSASESGRGSDETPHQVTLTRGFWLMEHEVTQGEWQAVMGSNPSRFTSCGSTCPVEQVSWDEIQTYIQKVSARDGVTYQLPTEAQWEYAARGGQEYIYAGSNDLGAVGWYDDNSGSKTHPGCQKQRNGYGLCDMSGNVWEWVQDLYAAYPGSTSDYVNNSSGSNRVNRGGSWSGTPSFARVALRIRSSPGTRSFTLGFRLARLQ